VLVTTLAGLVDDIARHDIAAPAVIVIGEIVRMRGRLLALLPQLAEEAMAWPPG
jgi:siroheme synthase